MTSEGPPSDRRTIDWPAIGVAVFLLALAGLVAWATSTTRAGIASYSRVSPRAVPYAIAAGLAAIAVVTLVVARRGRPAPLEHLEIGPPLWVVGGLVAQMALLPYLGFSAATGVVFAATARAFGRKPIWLGYLIGFPLALAIWLAFAGLLRLTLPAGPLEHGALAAAQAVVAFVRGIIA